MSGTKDEILNGGGERPKYAAPPVASELESDPQDNKPDVGGSAAGAGVQASGDGKGNPSTEPATPQPANPVAQLSDATKDIGGQVSDSTPKKLSYKEMYQALNPYTPPTAEEIERQRKKEKREKIFAALSDGLSALSNLFFTTKGAPNMYNPNNSQQDVVKDRWDKLKQERDQHMKEYTEGLMKAQALDDENDDNERKWQRLLRIDKDNAAKAKADQDRKDALADAQRGKFEAAARKDDAMTAYYKAKEYALNEGLPIDLALKKAQKAKEDAIADKNRRQGTSSWVSGKGGKGGSGGSGSGKPYGTFNGVEYKTKSDYERAVVAYAKDNKIPLTYNKKSTDRRGKVSTTQTNRTIAGLAAEGEKHYNTTHAAKPKPIPKPTKSSKPSGTTRQKAREAKKIAQKYGF